MTKRQVELMLFIQRCRRPPSVEEMRIATGNEGKGNVVRMLRVLEDKGYIRREKFLARSVEVLRRVPERVEWMVWDDATQSLVPHERREAA